MERTLTVFALSLFAKAVFAASMAYGVPREADVKAVMDRALSYIDESTPIGLTDSRNGQNVSDFRQINEFTRLKTGQYKLVCYEWGVTYSGVLQAYHVTKDKTYQTYLLSRLRFLAETAPYFRAVLRQGKPVDKQMNRLLVPHSLDDSGALCSAMIKTMLDDKSVGLNALIETLADCVCHKQSYLPDGIFCRDFPQRNSVWLDDMFMGVPTIAWMGRYTGKQHYYERAVKLVALYVSHMFVPERGLFRHGWVEAMNPHRFFPWGRANGWAILTLCEVLDALPTDYPGRDNILNILKKHIEGLVALQGKNGLWNQLLDRPDTYEETSASAIFTYCLAHAINEGWIDDKAYGPQVLLDWNGIASKVNAKGEVEGTCIGTGMGFDPYFYENRPTNVLAAYGYGPLLWAGSEVIRLLRTHHPKVNDGAVHFFDEDIKTDKAIFHVK